MLENIGMMSQVLLKRPEQVITDCNFLRMTQGKENYGYLTLTGNKSLCFPSFRL